MRFGVLHSSLHLIPPDLNSGLLQFRLEQFIYIASLLTHTFSPSPYAVHAHPPLNQGLQQGPPGALSPDMPGPTEPLSIARINEHYHNQRQAIDNRVEAEHRGYETVFGM